MVDLLDPHGKLQAEYINSETVRVLLQGEYHTTGTDFALRRSPGSRFLITISFPKNALTMSVQHMWVQSAN